MPAGAEAVRLVYSSGTCTFLIILQQGPDAGGQGPYAENK